MDIKSLITESLYDSIGRVRTGTALFWDSSIAGMQRPEIYVEESDGDKFSVSFVENEDRPGSTFSNANLDYNLGDWKLANIIHDFTFAHILSSTDVPLSRVFKHSGSEITKLTPDFVSETPEYILILEVSTTQGDSRSVHRAYGSKFEKYEPILRHIDDIERNNGGNTKPILYGIIIVGHDAVGSNLTLEEDDILELQLRFSVAIQLKGILENLNYIPKDEGASVNRKKLEQFFIKMDNLLKDPSDDLISGLKSRAINDEFIHDHLLRWDEDRIFDLVNGIDNNIPNRLANVLRDTVREVSSFKRDYCHDPNSRVEKHEEAHRKYEDEYTERHQGNLKEDMKAIINFPFISLKSYVYSRKTSEGLVAVKNPSIDNVYDTLYFAAIIKTLTDFNSSDEKDLFDQAAEDQEEPSSVFDMNLPEEKIRLYMSIIEKDSQIQEEMTESFKRKLNRFEVTLKQSERIDLALKGVQGKTVSEQKIKGKFNRNFIPEVKIQRDGQKDWYDLHKTNTTDIDDLLTDTEWLKQLIREEIPCSNSSRFWLDLVEHSRNLHNNDDMSKNERFLQEWFVKTNLFNWCKLITDIGTEVDISLKQNCKYDQFIFKKLRDFNVWLIIKPTKKDEKIFFSMLFKTEDAVMISNSTVFKGTHFLFNDETYQYTNFISLNESKILNWVLCLPRTIALLRFWSNFAGLKPYHESESITESENSPDYDKLIRHALPMIMLTIFIGLADKSEIEEEITRTRYLVMESLSEWPVEPKPYKMASKAPQAIRSRLTLWLYRKHKELSEIYTRNPPTSSKELLIGQGQTTTSTQLLWKGFINPYTGSSLDSPQQAINLFYLGYIKNKDETSQANKISKLYDKILIYELKFTKEISSKMGFENITTPTPHCFDVSLLVNTARVLKKKISQTIPDYLTIFEDKMSRFLFETSIEEEFATLKASSGFGPQLYDRKKVTSKYSRVKVIEKLSQKRGTAVTVADICYTSAIEVVTNRCLHIDIFRKPQHGGDREIYVLGFEERVVQRLIEQMSRILCSFVQEETMTHPYNKIKIPENSARLARTAFKSGYFNFNSSADASKWSQNNSSFKLMLPLLVLTPVYMHKTIIRILRLWEFKKILINPMILDLFDSHRDLLFRDETVQRLYNAYKGTSNERWCGPGNPFMEVTTGMMQGILHYTSSLYHSCVINKVKTTIEGARKSLLRAFKLPENIKLIMSHLQSSDDSYFGVWLPKPYEDAAFARLRCLATTILQFKVNLSSILGVENSIKTVLNSNHCFEFNSNFEFGYNHYKPDIKAIYSGFLISEQELLLARQEELSNLLTTYIENGGTNYVANGLQLGQSYLHYHLLGLNTTKYFRPYSEFIKILPDPSLGYFLMDNPLCPGLLGFNYSLWNAVATTNLGKLYKSRLRPIANTDKALENTLSLSIELSASGFIAPTYKLMHGNRKKWTELINRAGADFDWREQLSEKPELIFRRSLNANEVGLKIAMKLHSPGVSASLSRLNSLPRILAESAYILKYRAVSSVTNWMNQDKISMKKTTLIESLLEEAKILLEESQIDENELRILFPYHDDFLKHMHLLDSLRVSNITQSHREYKRKETMIEIATNNEYSLSNLRGLLLSFWFPDDQNIKCPSFSRETREFIFQEDKRIIPWIDKDLATALENSPFPDKLTLFQWLSTFSARKRVVRLLGTQIISRNGVSRLISVIVNNLSTNYRITLQENCANEVIDDSVVRLRSSFALAAAYPCSKFTKQKVMTELFKRYSDRLVFNYTESKSRVNDLVLAGKLTAIATDPRYIREHKREVLDLISQMKSNKHGLLGYFSVRQKSVVDDNNQVQYYGLGSWVGIIDGYDFRINLNNSLGEPTKVTSITTNTRLGVVESISLREFFSNMKWGIIEDSTTGKLKLSTSGINSISGAPINVDPNFEVDYSKLLELKITTEWSGHNYRCIASASGQRYTIVSITPKSNFVDYSMPNPLPDGFSLPAELKPVQKFLLRSWLTNEQVKPGNIHAMLTNNDLSAEEVELLKTNLISRLESTGLKKILPYRVLELAYIAREEQFTEDDLYDWQLDFDDDDVDSSLATIEDNDFLEDFEEHELACSAAEFYDILSEKDVIKDHPELKAETWKMHILSREAAREMVTTLGKTALEDFFLRRNIQESAHAYFQTLEVLVGEPRDSWNTFEIRLPEPDF
nr:MAG: RNA-dependent RNA polymerase [Anopheles phasivirus 1]